MLRSYDGDAIVHDDYVKATWIMIIPYFYVCPETSDMIWCVLAAARQGSDSPSVVGV